jgi:hypothetical protein
MIEWAICRRPALERSGRMNYNGEDAACMARRLFLIET